MSIITVETSKENISEIVSTMGIALEADKNYGIKAGDTVALYEEGTTLDRHPDAIAEVKSVQLIGEFQLVDLQNKV